MLIKISSHIPREKGELTMMKFNTIKSLYLILFSLFVISSNAKTPQEARKELAQMKITYSEDEFFACAGEGKIDAVKLFLDAGMNPNVKVRISDSFSIYLFFEKKNDVDFVNMLLSKDDQDNPNQKCYWTPLIVAACRNHTEVVKALLAKGAFINAKINAKADNGSTALMVAADQGCTETVKVLLANGADFNVKDNLNETALMWASGEGHTDIVQALLAKGANVNAKGLEGQPALIDAAKNGHTKTLKALLAKGAKIDAKDDNGLTALINAVFNGYTETVQALLAEGADVNAKDKDGMTALKYAELSLLKNHDEIVNLLKNAGARE